MNTRHLHASGQPWSTIIRRYRLTHNLKQTSLADDLNVTQAMVSRWESGAACPGPSMQKRILALINPQSNAVPMTGWRDMQARSPEMVAIIAQDGRVETVSEGLLRETGLDRLQFEGLRVSDLFGHEAEALRLHLAGMGFFEGQIEAVETTGQMDFRPQGQEPVKQRIHALHIPRRDLDGTYKWIANAAVVSEGEQQILLSELAGHCRIIQSI